MSTDLAVIPSTGEVLDLASLSTETIAAAVLEGQTQRQRWSEFDAAASAELVARMDRDTSWTINLTVDSRAVKITAPSPAAGSVVYLTDELGACLQGLVEGEVISEAAASKALKRRVIIECEIPWSADPHKIVEVLNEATVTLGGVAATIREARPVTAPVAAGIKALSKVPAAAQALAEIAREAEQGPRKATVKVK